MKSLLITLLASVGVAHSGAFLSVWEVPYVRDHLTITDVGRKLNKVFKWDQFYSSLREARTDTREDNLALYLENQEFEKKQRALANAERSKGSETTHYVKPMRSRSTTAR